MEMDAVLQAGDAKDWAYKGEGAANLILSYTGSSPSMLGKVLRVKKILKDKSQPAPNCMVFSSHEQLLWGHIPELVESVKQDCLNQAYAVHVMSQHLGANHVDGGVCIGVSRDFLELVEKNVLNSRPTWRVNASSVDSTANVALLIADHSLFSGNAKDSSCIAVEIKFLVAWEVVRAVFIPDERDKCLEDLSKVSGLELSDFIELLSEAIFKSGVLRKLLATQKLDDHDIEGAIHLYYNIISQPCLVCKNTTDAELLRKYALLHSLSLDKSLKIVRDFLISATAKDCSLMISFRPRESVIAESEYDSVFLESVERIYDYKAYFIDLDVKPLDKMEHYFKLDQKIVNFYTGNGEVGKSAKGSGTVTKH
ncbi:hypothetical protein PR202_ga18719 [Eleusine coracana subsp. coracana]|uniref:Inositol-pentakisphosphate 2-kinase n=1 Tax=Eleusine coracana subsp. coracana TaxID=191504 RepID=A0AAV5CU97_ELECO|nr:hypothetical protein PR202_ga18719 [Eleusine coracana subsp. coracana]